MKKLKLIWLLLGLELLWGPAHAEGCVSMLADVSGGVAIADTASARTEDWWPVQLLQCLAPRKVLALQNGARATLFFPGPNVSIELRGASRYEIMQDTARPLANAPVPERKALNAAFREIQLDRANLSSAGVRMRLPSPSQGPALLAPRGIVLSGEPVVFRWEAMSGHPQYRFQLAKSRTEIVYEATTDRTEVVLPANVAITPGDRLLWRVDVAAPDAKMSARWQDFIVATPEARTLAAQIDRDVPAPSAAERNLREVLLIQRMVRE
jgi:hypothetical protein